MQRQAEGIIAAKARGIRFGRPVIYNEDDYLDIFTKYHNKEMSLKEAKALIGCSKCSFYKMFNALKESGKLLWVNTHIRFIHKQHINLIPYIAKFYKNLYKIQYPTILLFKLLKNHSNLEWIFYIKIRGCFVDISTNKRYNVRDIVGWCA